MSYADVVFNRPLKRSYQYQIPDTLNWDVTVGALVEVPLRGQPVTGCVVDLSGEPADGLSPAQIKPIRRVLNPGYTIPSDIIRLAEWIADYYYCGLGEALHCASMIGFNEIAVRRLRVLRVAHPRRWDAPPTEWKVGHKIATPKQRALIQGFQEQGNRPLTRKQIQEQMTIGAAVVNRLLSEGILAEDEIDGERDELFEPSGDDERLETPLTLNPHQVEACAAVCETIDAHQYKTFLLHGVTGSGKTEVYLQAIAHTLAHGRQAITLVPEISLTPQTVGRFRRRFGACVGVYHSRMTLGQKYDLWRGIHAGQIKVIVGARSALFAPFRNPGLIIIDEEHETSYKQSDPAPRYHARDVAVVRAMQRKAAVVIGSATPSLESYHNCEKGKYTCLRLPARVSQLPMASVHLVDMSEEVTLRKNTGILSLALRDAVAERLEKKEQTILFLNRRGFSCFQICWACRAVPQCQRCAVSLTYHKGLHKLVCHYCDRAVIPYRQCPQCGSDQLQMIGMGTERVEETLRAEYPAARLLRIDQDTTGSREAFANMWLKICNHEVDIIIGTQMIAKGIHIENVTLVGVISADFPLFQPDFRSAERAFSLLTQVTGRAGRGQKPGEVFIQTYQPRHYSIQFATRQDYEGFYEKEIRSRALMRFPPHQRLIAILIADTDHDQAHGAARAFATLLKERAARYQDPGLTVFSATPAPIALLRGRHRFTILMRGDAAGRLRHILEQGLEQWARAKAFPKVNLTIDVDPVDLM